MIGRTNAGGGGGGGNISFTLNAAKGETVTITQNGATVLTVTMPDVVQASTAVTLPKGIYSFTGSVSEYTATVELNNKTKTVNVYPAGAVYWYGRNLLGGGFDSEASKNKNATNILTLTTEETDIYGYLTNPSGTSGAQWLLHTVNTVDGTEFSSIKAKVTTKVSSGGNGFALVGINTDKASASGTASVSGKSDTKSGTYEIVANIADKTVFYPCFGGNKGGSYAYTLGVTMNALWLE